MAVARLLTTLLAAARFAAEASQLAEPSRPVAEVISMLQDMMKTLEADQKADEETYNNMACWCETNDKEKTQAISDAESHIEYLESEIKSLNATSAKLSAQITALEAEVLANEQALAQATNIRQQQSSDFTAEETELNESIAALQGAVDVLSKHHSNAFLQAPGVSSTRLLSTATMLQEQMRRHSKMLTGSLRPSQRRVLAAFVQSQLGQEPDYIGATPTHLQSYAPQSGDIYGILQQMLETFEANLATATREEAEAQAAYAELSVAKNAEIQAGNDQIATKTQERSDADSKRAAAEQDLLDTKASLSADEQYLMNLKETCTMTDEEWEQRQKTRQDEMQAVSKAIAVLGNGDSHDTFHRTFNPSSFLQLARSSQVDARSKAAALLTGVAEKLHAPTMSSLATMVKLDNFTKVKEIIDKMVEDLLQEKDDEIKFKDYCVTELDTNERQTQEKEGEKQTTEGTINSLETTIQTLTTEIGDLKTEISDMHLSLKRAGEDREKENREFQKTVADQRETQKLLETAKAHLMKFYGEALVQQQQKVQHTRAAGPPPPPGFDAYANNPSAAGVLGLIDQIIADAKQMETEAVNAESVSQTAYETLVKETNDSIETKSKSIVDKTDEKSQAEADLADAEADLASITTELDRLSSYAADMHEQCDFVLKNFEVRQTARDEEVAALRQAKAILSGEA